MKRFMAIGVGRGMDKQLDPRHYEAFSLTAAQSILNVSLLLKLRFGLASAVVLFPFFAVQLAGVIIVRNDPPEPSNLFRHSRGRTRRRAVVFVWRASAALRSIGQHRGGLAARQLPDSAKPYAHERTFAEA
jgi:hypothetical protein